MAKKFQQVQEQVNNVGKASTVVIEHSRRLQVCVEVTGDTLLQNAFSQKAVEEMLRKHMGFSVEREKKVPADCVERATIRNEQGRVCVPPTAFKKAMLTAAGALKQFKMAKTRLRTELYVVGKSIPITYARMTPQMDMVRTSGMTRTPDVRFRPRFDDWKARILLEFADSMAVQTVVDLLDRAGSVGVGEWRPERSGTFGTFSVTRHIDDQQEIAEVMTECSVPLKALVIPEWAMNAEIDPELLKRIASEDAPATEEE